MKEEKDSRIKRQVFPFSVFFGTFGAFAVVTTLQMKIIGDQINYWKIPRMEVIAVIFFWLLGSAAFTLFIKWEVRKKYQEPLERISAAAKKVAEGDFSVYLRPEHTQDKADCLDILVGDFNKMVEELGSIETLKTDFFSNVSHEFKTPLSVIYSNAQMLEKCSLEEKEQAYVKNILDSSVRLSSLIQNMLKLNRLEKQVIQPAAEEYDVCAQICECAVQYEESWEKKDIDFEADLEDYAMIQADPGLMEIVWNNLFSNAVKFTPEGGTITLTQKCEDGYAVVSVSDTGCGMTPEVMAHIFDKFYQGDKSHATFGNGLGLALVKRILELSDASITVTSEPQKGSTFTVRVPLAEKI